MYCLRSGARVSESFRARLVQGEMIIPEQPLQKVAGQPSRAIKIQVAGGLGIYRLKHTNFKQILRPSAKTLLLTGDCLTVSQQSEPISKEFMEYLQTNWNRVIYIPGRSELNAPGAPVPAYPSINYSYRIHCPIGLIHTVIGATYLASGDTWLSTEERWVYETISSEIRHIILASYSPLPKDTYHAGHIAAIIQGTGKNQFCPKKPIVNHYSDYTGELRSDYNPEFVLELR